MNDNFFDTEAQKQRIPVAFLFHSTMKKLLQKDLELLATNTLFHGREWHELRLMGDDFDARLGKLDGQTVGVELIQKLHPRMDVKAEANKLVLEIEKLIQHNPHYSYDDFITAKEKKSMRTDEDAYWMNFFNGAVNSVISGLKTLNDSTLENESPVKVKPPRGL